MVVQLRFSTSAVYFITSHDQFYLQTSNSSIIPGPLIVSLDAGLGVHQNCHVVCIVGSKMHYSDQPHLPIFSRIPENYPG